MIAYEYAMPLWYRHREEKLYSPCSIKLGVLSPRMLSSYLDSRQNAFALQRLCKQLPIRASLVQGLFKNDLHCNTISKLALTASQ